jgi:hypothetical protein
MKREIQRHDLSSQIISHMRKIIIWKEGRYHGGGLVSPPPAVLCILLEGRGSGLVGVHIPLLASRAKIRTVQLPTTKQYCRALLYMRCR